MALGPYNCARLHWTLDRNACLLVSTEVVSTHNSFEAHMSVSNGTSEGERFHPKNENFLIRNTDS